LRNGDGLLVYFDVCPRVDKFPIGSDGGRNRGDSLRRESPVGNFAVVFCYTDVASVNGDAKPFKSAWEKPIVKVD